MNSAADAELAAALLAVDPPGLGGACLRSQVHPARGQWLTLLRELLPTQAPLRRIPCTISDSRLLGGLDLVATLKANRPVAEQGVLAACDGGVVILAMAERLPVHTAACLTAVMDQEEITLARDGLFRRLPVRFGVVAFDESLGEDEALGRPLLDRLAFLLDFQNLDARIVLKRRYAPAQVLAARERLPQIRLEHALIERLCGTALALGVISPRVAWLAVRVARAAAALDARDVIDESDAVLAGRLVLAPRATLLPMSSASDPGDGVRESPPAATVESENSPSESQANEAAADGTAGSERASGIAPTPRDIPDDVILEATQAAIPADLLMRLQSPASAQSSLKGGGRAGLKRSGLGRGRPIGIRAGPPHAGARLNVLETLRAAAPWQRLRGRGLDARLRIHPSDLRITACQQRSRTLSIFAVDASGSAALNRLAEAKGAVELLLA